MYKQEYQLPRTLTDLYVTTRSLVKESLIRIKSWLLKDKPLKIDSNIRIKSYFKSKELI